MKIDALVSQLQASIAQIEELRVAHDEITIVVPAAQIVAICQQLRCGVPFRFEMLIDLCGVDYLHYGVDEWQTEVATRTGFERAVHPLTSKKTKWDKPRFAVVYHLLSLAQNTRLRVKAFISEEEPMIDSVTGVWNCANWYEREAFDLYGILFLGHPDLRRLLTDYGFIGHPFRKDFPLVGNVEVRYDAKQQRVIYEPVDIVPRTLVPKVIRKEFSLLEETPQEGPHHG